MTPNVEVAVIDSALNLIFRCAHRHLTRPFSPVSVYGVRQGDTYVLCLDCGKEFAYDLKEMKIGKPIDRSHEGSVVPPDMPISRKKELKFAFWVALPFAVAAGAALKTAKPKRIAKQPANAAPAKPREGEPGPR